MLKQRGFTLIEVLLSVVILSIGIIGVSRPFLASLNSLDYLNRRSEVSRLLTQKYWELESESEKLGQLNQRAGKGDLVGSRDMYHYKMRATPVPPGEGLHRLDFRVSWSQAGTHKTLDKEMFLYVPPQENHEE